MDLFFQLRQQIYDIYSEVVKEFPSVKEDEIKLIYLSSWGGKAGYLILNKEETKKEPEIIVGNKFFSLSREEQKGAMAHELGHHETVKNFTIPRLKRRSNWIMMYNYDIIPSSRPHWKERLEKRHRLEEISADTKAAKTKYGKYLLTYYKKQLAKGDKVKKEISDRTIQKQIEKRHKNIQNSVTNLEQQLREENV